MKRRICFVHMLQADPQTYGKAWNIRMEQEKIIAMAAAAAAEENGVDVKRIIVRSFREIQKSSLETYIEDNHISYRKYQLEASET